jgi:hypothetical protein
MATDPYQMRRPDMAEAKAAVGRLYGHTSDDVWRSLLTRTGLTGRETDPAAIQRLAQAMLADDSVLSLCGRSLLIRINGYEFLLAAAAVIAEAK